MQQFYDPPSYNGRLDLQELFPKKRTQSHDPQAPDFVPFSQERDKLGRLISRQQLHRIAKRRQSLKSQAQSISSRVNGQISTRGKTTDKKVETIFKVRSVQNIQSSKQGIKLKISAGTNKMTWSPSVGQYNSAQIADRMKFNKSRKAEIRVKPESYKIQPVTLRQIKSLPNSTIKKLVAEQKPTLLPRQQLQLNPNLPELQKFHTMQRLQMQVCPNFQRDHQKFKSLMRDSLVLANKIKRQLQLD